MGCLLVIIGLAMLGFFGYHANEDWLIWAGVLIVVAGFDWKED